MKQIFSNAIISDRNHNFKAIENQGSADFDNGINLSKSKLSLSNI